MVASRAYIPGTPAGVGAEIRPSTPAGDSVVDRKIDHLNMTHGARPWPSIWGSIEELYGSRNGGTAVVMGSGPSTKAVDLSMLSHPNVFVIAINQEPFQGHPFVPDAWIYHDLGVANGRRRSYLSPNVRVIATKVNAYQCCLGGTSGVAANGPAVWRDNPTSIFQPTDLRAWTFGDSEMKLPIRRTTATMAIALCALMGFSRILLVGIDLHYLAPDPDSKQKKPPVYYNRLETKDGLNPKLGKDQYLGEGRWVSPILASMRLDIDMLEGKIRNGGWRGQIVQTNVNAPGQQQREPFEKAMLQCQ